MAAKKQNPVDTTEQEYTIDPNAEYDRDSVFERLRAPFPPELVSERVSHRDRYGNEHKAQYLEWHVTADRLDEAFPAWESEVRLAQYGDIMTATVRLTICGVTREGVGVGDAGKEIGIKKAEHDALKRAAIKFGVGRELYKHESSFEETEGAYSGSTETGFPSNPVAATTNDLASTKQIGAIRAIARDLQVDADAECFAAMSVDIGELNRKGASALIEHLKAIQSGAAVSLQGQPEPGIDRTAEYDQTRPAVAAARAPLPRAPQTQQYSGPPVSGASDNTQRDPVARSLGDMVTAKQLGMIKAIAREADLNAESECQHLMKCGIEELSKRAASDLIEHMQTLARTGEAMNNAAPRPMRRASAEDRPLPAARTQAASVAQGRFASQGQVTAIQRIAGKIGYGDEDVALEYSNQRTRNLAELSEAEAADAIRLLQGS